MHEYIGGTIRGLGGIAECVGGVDDHVHILAGLKPSHQLSNVVRDVKIGSCKWAHLEVGSHNFAWQDGYSVFTVSATALDGVRNYILHQEQHHHKKSYREELEELFRISGVKYELKYILD